MLFLLWYCSFPINSAVILRSYQPFLIQVYRILGWNVDQLPRPPKKDKKKKLAIVIIQYPQTPVLLVSSQNKFRINAFNL